MTRCKFTCVKTGEQKGWDEKDPILYSAELVPIVKYNSVESEENKKFWAATPSGEFKIAVARQQPFEVGKEYYLDISLAE